MTSTILQVWLVRLSLVGLISRSGQALPPPRPSVTLCVCVCLRVLCFVIAVFPLTCGQLCLAGPQGGKEMHVSVCGYVCVCVSVCGGDKDGKERWDEAASTTHIGLEREWQSVNFPYVQCGFKI